MNTRLVIGIVGAALLMAVALIGALAWAERAVPDVLTQLPVGCLGLLGGILVPNRERATDAPTD